ncbi:MAG: hypothetical protein ACRCUX_09495 [Beijerinckiaceae bacterium]
MQRLIRFLAIAGAVVWSLFAWGAYALVNWVGGVAARNADWATGHPETVEWLSWAAGLMTSAGLVGVVVIWAIGLVLFLIVAALARRSRIALPRPVR